QQFCPLWPDRLRRGCPGVAKETTQNDEPGFKCHGSDGNIVIGTPVNHVRVADLAEIQIADGRLFRPLVKRLLLDDYAIGIIARAQVLFLDDDEDGRTEHVTTDSPSPPQ